MSSLFTADFKTQAYWWDRTPRPQPDSEAVLPARVDVAVIGSGYTGLSAALQTARGGRTTLVLDAEAAGWGCSSRNGGQISTSTKPEFDALARRHGAETARAIVEDGHQALRWIEAFVAEEDIACDFEVVGRFHAAHNAAAFRRLAESAKHQVPGLDTGAEIVPRSEQHREIGTDAYHGGVVLPRHAALDPARFHQGLLARVQQAGATIATHCPVTAIERQGGTFTLSTPRGRVTARDVVVATNGYTGNLVPWLQRRVIPIGSYIIATEARDAEEMARIIPRNRIVSDSRKVVYYYRLSPDRRRMLFGGRVSHSETDPRISGPLLHAEMSRLFPALSKVGISHSWMGFVAYTFDTLAHAGRHDGMHYAMGYCGSGVSMASYLGMRTGQKILGLKEGRTGVDATTFQTRPLYHGNPWFLAPSISYYRWRDSLNV
jgi:glycine/D-amino acid oxidase-like deaminating enzyme